MLRAGINNIKLCSAMNFTLGIWGVLCWVWLLNGLFPSREAQTFTAVPSPVAERGL